MSFNQTILQFMQRKFKLLFVLLVAATVSCSPNGYGEIPLTITLTSTYPAPVNPTEKIITITPAPTRTAIEIVLTATSESLDVFEDIKKFNLDEVKPFPGEERLQKAKVFIDSVEIISNAFLPNGMLEVAISGSLPTPCHVLRADMQILEEERQILIDVYSLADTEKSCIQVLEPFVLQIPVDLEIEGNYRVLVNQIEMSQFNWPEQP